MKKYFNKFTYQIIGIVFTSALLIVINVLCLTSFDNILYQYLGTTEPYTTQAPDGVDVNYNVSEFDSVADLYAYEEDKCAEISQEGITLLKNDGLLPLSKNTTLSLFSHSSVDLVSGGSGSGSGSFQLTKNLKEGLENAGLRINENLWEFYKNGEGSNYKRGIGVINYGAGLDWSINECPLSKIISDERMVTSFNDTIAMFVMSRTGGEGGDEARDMNAYGGNKGEHYLEPDETELEIIEYLNNNFDNVILLVNCNNAIELGWTEQYQNIKAIINFPGAGRTGTYGLGYMLTGLDKSGEQISPSGHLVDTFVYDNFSSPAMQNMGDYRYEDSKYYYVSYSEGIYVGYKYYETRYEDYVTNRSNVGSYVYQDTVKYPFGFGLSYTNFEWSNFTMSDADENGNIKISLNVKNSGAYRGKEVVQIYVQTPYTSYDIENGIEKSAVSLIGFEKTKNLNPGESQKVEIQVNLKDMISYDDNNLKTYFLEKGDYYITAASDAHAAINNILRKRNDEGDWSILSTRLVPSILETTPGNSDFVGLYTQEENDITTYSSYSHDFGQGQITNQFDYAKNDEIKYLSRNNWSMMDNNGLRYGEVSSQNSDAEIDGKQFSHKLTKELKEKLDSTLSLNPTEGKLESTIKLNQDNGVELIDLRGKSFQDPMWDDLLSQMSINELHKLIAESGYCSPAIDSINKPKVTDLDGPAGLNEVVRHGSVDLGDGYLAMTWPTQYMLASSWNGDLSYQMGQGVGEDGLFGKVSGWYGPGMNIHRTPFAGRNFEYYSEDSFLSGTLGRLEVQGASSKGMYAFVKHFALNDQETHRDHLGLVTWADEQTIREIYLKPFEMTVVNNYTDVSYNSPVYDSNGHLSHYEMKTVSLPSTFAIMTSFNRIGTVWAGGNYQLITKVLREEWGFQGFVLSDYEVTSYMHTSQALAAGADAKLTTVDWGHFSLKNSPAYHNYAYDAAHRILYTVVNSQAMNGFIHGVRYVNGFATYKIILIVLDTISISGIGVWIWLLRKKYLKERKESL